MAPPAVLLPLLVLSLQLLLPGTAAASSMPIVTPINKDPYTKLYTIPIKNGEHLLLDLAGPLVWSECQPSQPAIPCEGSVCKIASRSHPAGCGNNGQPQPPNGNARCTCTAYPYNPASGQCGAGTVTKVALFANATDGKNPLFPVSFTAYEACAPSGGGFGSSAAAGVAGLSRLPLALPSQVAARLKVPRQFAICLAWQTGVAIFGGGPFHLPPWVNNDLADDLRRDPAVPLLRNPRNNGAYYLRVHGIAVNQARLRVPRGAFHLDAHRGTGGVVLSTTTPYTTLRSDIYNALVDAFGAVTTPPRRPDPVAPFRLCYDKHAFSIIRIGPSVANIDLMLDGGRNWTIVGGSSMVQVDDQTLCLAFLEMGAEQAAVPESPAVILGGYQIEEILMLFDLEKETLGFSSLLLGKQTSCGNFNFASRS